MFVYQFTVKTKPFSASDHTTHQQNIAFIHSNEPKLFVFEMNLVCWSYFMSEEGFACKLVYWKENKVKIIRNSLLTHTRAVKAKRRPNAVAEYEREARQRKKKNKMNRATLNASILTLSFSCWFCWNRARAFIQWNLLA